MVNALTQFPEAHKWWMEESQRYRGLFCPGGEYYQWAWEVDSNMG